MIYSSDVIRTMRSVMMELSLSTGGEYTAFLLVHVKATSQRIFEDPDTYERLKTSLVPREFWKMTILWNQDL